MIARLGHDLAAWLVPVNAWTLALLVTALLLDRTLAFRMSASLRIALYAPVALRVLVPLAWSVPVAHVPRMALALPADAVTRGAPGGASPSLGGYAVIGGVYLAVAVLLGALAVGRRWRLARALRWSRTWALPGEPYPIATHEELGPMVVGLVSPRIVLPIAMVDGERAETLACVLRHEKAHLRRLDPWLSAGIEVLLAVAWPVLPLWFAAARVRHLVELACDEAALDGADASECRRYGHVLLDLAEHGSALFAGTAALHFGATLRARIEAIAHRRPWSLPVQGALTAVAVVTMVACSSAGPEAAPPSSSPAPQPAAALAARNDVDGAGRIDPEIIRNVVRQNFGRFRSCYEDGARSNASLAGVVRVSYAIQRDGSTRDAKSLESTLPDAKVVQCVVDGFSKLTYPPPEGGIVTVVYPIEFTP